MEIITKLISSANRPNIKIIPKYLTIHNTGNNAPAINERNNIQNNVNRKSSFNWVVDYKQAILCIPENEMSWHSGTKEGNLLSIGLEICEPLDGLGVASPEWPIIYENSVKLASIILKRHNWETDKLRTHKSWSNKNCPRLLLPIWDKFVLDVQKELKSEVEKKSIKIKVNNKIVKTDELPLIDNKLYMSIRDICDLLNIKIDYASGVINIIK